MARGVKADTGGWGGVACGLGGSRGPEIRSVSMYMGCVGEDELDFHRVVGRKLERRALHYLMIPVSPKT